MKPRFSFSVLLIVVLLAINFTACVPSSQCENVADIVRQATLFLCMQTSGEKQEAYSAELSRQLIVRLRSYPENSEAQTLITKLQALR